MSHTARRRWVVVPVTLVLAVVVNLVVFGIGHLAGGSFAFTAAGIGRTTVTAAIVAGFTAVPLGAGLVVVAALVPRLPWVEPVASVVAPVLAVGTIFTMTLPADLDAVSTATLATCHLTLAVLSVLAVRRIARRTRPWGAGDQ